MRRVLAIALALAALAAAGCGGDNDGGGAAEPAVGELSSPKVPEGAAYDLDGRGWAKLGQSARFDAAGAYIDDNPSRCDGARASDVAFYVTNSYGLDFPEDVPAAEVLAEGCDAARQS